MLLIQTVGSLKLMYDTINYNVVDCIIPQFYLVNLSS